MATSRIDDELWEQFHDAVNMTSRELGDWLREEGASVDAEPLPSRPVRRLDARCSRSWASAART